MTPCELLGASHKRRQEREGRRAGLRQADRATRQTRHFSLGGLVVLLCFVAMLAVLAIAFYLVFLDKTNGNRTIYGLLE